MPYMGKTYTEMRFHLLLHNKYHVASVQPDRETGVGSLELRIKKIT